MSRPFCVGLTGGIGSGKSLVASLFAKLGIEVIDTDVIAREMTKPSGAAIQAIREVFGQDFLTAVGALDRPRMRERVFADVQARQQLENILHPMIRQAVTERLSNVPAPYVLIVVPLLVETGAYDNLVDRILVVDCEPAQQIERVMERDGVARTMAMAMRAAQADRLQRLAVADDIIDNRGGADMLVAKVAELHRVYLMLSNRAKADVELH